MTETSTETRYSLGDRVTVASHFVWCGHDTHGRTGKVVEVHSFADTTFYEVGFGDGRAPAPYLAHELFLVRRGGLGAVRHLIHATGPDGSTAHIDLTGRPNAAAAMRSHLAQAGYQITSHERTEENETP